MVFRIEVNLGNRFLLLKTMKRRFGNIQTSNLFSVNTPKHIKHCQQFCTFCSPERYTIMIHNENVNQIHYTMCPYDELLIMAKLICTNLVHDPVNNNNSNNCLTILVLSITCGKLSNYTKYNPFNIIQNTNLNNNTSDQKYSTTQAGSLNPLNTIISINIQTISRSIKRSKHQKSDYKQSRTRSKWGVVNMSINKNIHSDIRIDVNSTASTHTTDNRPKKIDYIYDNNHNHYCCYYYYYYYCYHYYYYYFPSQNIPYFKSFYPERILDTNENTLQVDQVLPKSTCDNQSNNNQVNQNVNRKNTNKAQVKLTENDTDHEVMQYMSKCDLVKNCAETQFRSQKLIKSKSGILSVNSRPPEPVGCQLLQMTSAPVSVPKLL
ncbi:unnamed protein product [Heterobilharzia americana]|nr:unnamed protein product [Heterobilharzia americana]